MRVCLASAVLAVAFSGTLWGGGPSVVIPLAERMPVVDGVIGEDEWRDSAALSGFLTQKPVTCLAAVGGEGVVHFACDGRTLYLACRFAACNNDPGGGLLARATERDGEVSADDNIELLVRSGREADVTRHIFVNARDVVLDRLWPVDRPAENGWDCAGLRVRSVVKAKIWECEMALPLASLGIADDRLLVNVIRNAPECGSARLVPTADYRRGDMLEIAWRKGAPAIQMLPLGRPQEGEWSTGIRIARAEPEARYAVRLSLTTKYRPEVEGVRVAEKSGELSAGGELRLVHVRPSRNDYLAYAASVVDQTGKTVLERSLLAKRGRRRSAVPITLECDLGTVATAVAFYYPGLDRARITVEPQPKHRLTGVSLACGNEEVRAEPAHIGGFSALVKTPPSVGPFTVGVTLESEVGSRRFADAIALEKRPCAWLGRGLGTEEIILPPFTPIEADGASFDVLLRRCRLTAAGLPAQVTALGRDILAGDAYYEIETADGRIGRFSGPPPSIAVRKGGYEADVTTVAKTENGVSLETRTTIDYDGFQKNAVRLAGVEGRPVNRLTLVVPFRDAEVPLWHICTADAIRSNPTGALPGGEGLLWEGTKLRRSSEFIDPMMAPQTVPYVWLGAERRGLCWCVNNTCGFKLDAAKPSVRIFRADGVVRLEIDIINRPVRLREGASFAFAFEATPVKPADRRLMRQFQTALGGVPEGFALRKNIDWINLGYFNMWAHGPEDGNWDAYAATCRRVREGAGYGEFFADMTNAWERLDARRRAYAETMPNMGKSPYHRWMRSCWRENVRYFSTLPSGGVPLQYSDPTLSFDREEALRDFKSEWVSRSTGYLGATRCFLTPSRIDYLLDYHRRQLRHGLYGIYLDDMFPITCRNPDTSMQRDDEGRWHGNLGLFEMRELVRRIAVMQHQSGLSPRLLQVHMTNCLLVPCFAFATSALSWEDHYGEDEFQKRYRPDYIRAESLGTQIGCEAVALDGICRGSWDERDWKRRRFAFLTRTQLAVQLPMGVKPARRPQLPFAGYDAKTLYSAWGALGRFGIWEDACRFVPCYEDDGAVAGAPADVLVASWRRKGEIIVVFGNQEGVEKSFTPVLDRRKLDLSPRAQPFDAESGKLIEGNGIVLQPWDYALIRYAEVD